MKINVQIDPKTIVKAIVPWGPHGKMKLKAFRAASLLTNSTRRDRRSARWKKVNLTPAQLACINGMFKCKCIQLTVDDAGTIKTSLKWK